MRRNVEPIKKRPSCITCIVTFYITLFIISYLLRRHQKSAMRKIENNNLGIRLMEANGQCCWPYSAIRLYINVLHNRRDMCVYNNFAIHMCITSVGVKRGWQVARTHNTHIHSLSIPARCCWWSSFSAIFDGRPTAFYIMYTRLLIHRVNILYKWRI